MTVNLIEIRLIYNLRVQLESKITGYCWFLTTWPVPGMCRDVSRMEIKDSVKVDSRSTEFMFSWKRSKAGVEQRGRDAGE